MLSDRSESSQLASSATDDGGTALRTALEEQLDFFVARCLGQLGNMDRI